MSRLWLGNCTWSFYFSYSPVRWIALSVGLKYRHGLKEGSIWVTAFLYFLVNNGGVNKVLFSSLSIIETHTIKTIILLP